MTPVFVETLAGALLRHARRVYRPLYFGFKRCQEVTEIAPLPSSAACREQGSLAHLHHATAQHFGLVHMAELADHVG